MNKTFDPKLRQAIGEINAILKRYNIAGAIGLASSTHAEFSMQFPTWSLITIEQGGIRCRTLKAEQQRTDDSAHLLYSLRDITSHYAAALKEVTDNLERHIDVEHKNPFTASQN